MDVAMLAMVEITDQQNQKIQEVVSSNRGRLLDFIRFRIPEEAEAEDILQDVFYELVQSYRLMKPVQQLASWLFAVARNKITDSYRKQKTIKLDSDLKQGEEDDDTYLLADILQSSDDTADTILMRESIMEAVMEGLDELPEEQRLVFEMHEFEGYKFEQIATLTGASVKTLISRKRYAVLYLRDRLQYLYDELLIN
ncbi:MAG: sigma-70 family RNA polymerase sigma factor [Bacteroidetes bacterium]|nr:sigma-70 family RNA polymerase sigma factor [Bacteroidota bacterium]